MRIEFSFAAKEDYVELVSYGAMQFGRKVAQNYAESLINRLDILRDHPSAGPKLTIDNRILVHRSHVIIYRVTDTGVLIVRILDSRQNWQALELD